MNAKMIGENPIKTNKAKAEDQIIIYYAIQSTVVEFNLWRDQLKMLKFCANICNMSSLQFILEWLNQK